MITRSMLAVVLGLVGAMALVGQDVPSRIKEKTPPPSRVGVYAIPVAPGQANSREQVLPASPPQGRRQPQNQGLPEPTGKGGSFAMELDDDDPTLESEDGTAEAELDLSGRTERSISDEIRQDPTFRRQSQTRTAQSQQPRTDPTIGMLQEAFARQKKTDDKLQEMMKRQDEATTQVFGKRDATKTDAAMDAEFAEAMASRKASTIARDKGYSLIPALRTIRMRIRNMADSEQAGGKLKATVLDDVWDATHSSIGIPSGATARLYIEGAQGDTDTRIRATVTEFQLPGGDTIQLRVPDAAQDSIGATGPKASVDHRWGTRFAGATGYAIISALAAQGSRAPSSTNASFDDVLRNNMSGQFGQIGLQGFQNGMQAKPIMRLAEGTIIEMTLGTNLYLVPWKRVRPLVPVPRLLLPKLGQASNF